MDSNSNDGQDLLDDLPERITIAKQGIPIDTQQAYLAYVKQLNDIGITNAIATNKQCLFDETSSLDEKKQSLILLGQAGTVEACLAISNFVESANAALKDWGILALETGWLLAESKLLDQERALILTGLGGEGHRLRYFYAIPAQTATLLTDAQQPNIEQTFTAICNNLDSKIETMEIHPTYLTVLLLVSQDVAVATVIEAAIAVCNQPQPLLYPNYLVTNTTIPPENELLSYLEQLKEA